MSWVRFGKGERRYVSFTVFRRFFWVNTKFPFFHRTKLIRPNFFQRIIRGYLLYLIENDPIVRHALARVQLSYNAVTFEEDGTTRVHWKVKKK